MNIAWQNLATIAIVFAAVIYLARGAWLVLSRGRSGCSSCSGCSAKASGNGPSDGRSSSGGPQVVELKLPEHAAATHPRPPVA